MSIKILIQAWNNFWFAPQSPIPIALFRIFLGLILLQDTLLMRIPDWRLYYSAHALIPIEDTMVHWWGKDPYFDLMALLPQGDQWQLIFLWLYALALLFMTLGLFTRVSSVAAYLMNLSMDNHFILNQNDGDVFLRLVLMMLCLSNCGEALSLDNLIRSLRADWRKEGFGARMAPQWAMRMIQLQLSIVYFHSYLTKLTGDHWVKGVACYYALRYEDMVRFPLPRFFEQLWVCQALSWGTLAIEFALFSLIWIKEFRYWVLLAGLLLHLGIDYSMSLPLFEWSFMAAYIVFVYPEDLVKVMGWIRAAIAQWDGPPYLVAYDGNCVFCIRVVGLAHRLDIFRRFDFIDFRDPQQLTSCPDLDPARAEQKMQLKLRSHWIEGFQAFRFMTTRMPLLWCLFVFISLPGMNWLGERIYAWVSSHRYLILGGTCETALCLSKPSQLKA
jgi:predicted DCC family thiol-disulfide oxidoreductase YuxK